MKLLRTLVDGIVRIFEFGLLITIILNWLSPAPLARLQQALNKFYDIFLNPIRRFIKPIRFSPSAPAALDLTPIILLLIIWLLLHPFLMWLLR